MRIIMAHEPVPLEWCALRLHIAWTNSYVLMFWFGCEVQLQYLMDANCLKEYIGSLCYTFVVHYVFSYCTRIAQITSLPFIAIALYMSITTYFPIGWISLIMIYISLLCWIFWSRFLSFLHFPFEVVVSKHVRKPGHILWEIPVFLY